MSECSSAAPSVTQAAGVRDAVSTVASIALVAYLTADLVHHALGHAALWLLQGGQIKLLSSVLVVCSRTGVAVDLAGPLANLACGAAAVLALRHSTRLSAPAELFWVLLAQIQSLVAQRGS